MRRGLAQAHDLLRERARLRQQLRRGEGDLVAAQAKLLEHMNQTLDLVVEELRFLQQDVLAARNAGRRFP